MVREIVTIAILALATWIVHAVCAAAWRVRISVIGLVLAWPLVMALVNGWAPPVRIGSAVLLLAAVYLVARSVRPGRGGKANARGRTEN